MLIWSDRLVHEVEFSPLAATVIISEVVLSPIKNMKREEIIRQLQSFVFFIGCVLSPFTTWNDSFVNIPLSYLIANFLYVFVRSPFRWLFIGSYIFTNILGLLLMFSSGKEYVLSTKSKIKALFSLVINTVLFSTIIYLLDKSGILAPLSVYFLSYNHNK